MVIIETFIPIVRVCLFAIGIVWSVRFFSGLKYETGVLAQRLLLRARKFPQDLVIIGFMPTFAYIAFIDEEQASKVGGVVCIALALYMLINLLFGLQVKNRK